MVLKAIAKTAIGAYIAAYLALSGHVIYDYFRYRAPEIQQGRTATHLEVRRYKVKVNGKERVLTLVGENHSYTAKEHEIGRKLVSDHQHFASECGGCTSEGISLSNLLYGTVIAIPGEAYWLYSDLGSGRHYDSIRKIAKKKGFEVHALENPNDAFDNLDLKQRGKLFGVAVAAALTAPLGYYRGKQDKPYNSGDAETLFYKKPLIYKRDRQMAKALKELLEKDGIDKLLAAVGKGHVDGITRNLAAHAELEEINYGK